MNEIRIESNQEEIVLYFGTKHKSINAYTFASTLVSFADAIKTANKVINPGYDVEILVADLGSGSFKAVIKTIYKIARNLFSDQRVEAIILAILAAFLYDTFFSKKPNVQINVSQDYVIVEQGQERVVIPKVVYDAKEEVEKVPQFKEDISNAIQSIKQDKSVESFSIVNSINEVPTIEINRDCFDAFIINRDATDPLDNMENERIITENTILQIIRAILENNSRKWEFVWNGEKIPAPVLDDHFYELFYEHKITIAPGDSLRVELKIYQKKADYINVYMNYRYEVVKVFEHIPSKSKEQNLIE